MKTLSFLTGCALLAATLPAPAQGHPGPQTPTQSPGPAPAPAPSHGGDGGRGEGHSHGPSGPGHPGNTGVVPPNRSAHPGGPGPGGNRVYSGNSGFHGPYPRHRTRATVCPDARYWRGRDIMEEIQAMARRGSIPVIPVGADVKELEDYTPVASGWKAYGFVVPAKGTLHVRLYHPNTGWFRLMMSNKWGQVEQGMLQNLIPTGNPEVKYQNPTDEPRAVYVVVDDPGWMSSKKSPYKLVIERGGEPAKPGEPGPKPAVAIPPSR